MARRRGISAKIVPYHVSLHGTVRCALLARSDTTNNKRAQTQTALLQRGLCESVTSNG
ncbi:hypothetical protein BSU04_12310 [Caballeronia sordidicola]|uniref:Uncharacterized protein n=1 Tax=Caballeronia sordidicola TaxID=196367 RepID=A0A226X505_CABSO|nr:hypothetical protein BSU04_12310 [Caballeronia sordidicola]